MPVRSRRHTIVTELSVDEGPFVSFTDLFIGILFLFLILVAALMLMHQEVVHQQKVETQRIEPPPPPPKPEPLLPAFRLGIVFNIYQRSSVSDGINWTYSRTVRVFRSPDGRCINTVWMRSNLSTSWKPPVADEDIPTAEQQDQFKKFEPCGLSGSGDHWDSASETGTMKRITPDLYTGSAVLHTKEGDEKLEMQYRVLGVFDDYFRFPKSPGASG